HNPRHAQAGRNPELRALFHKVSVLNQAGVIAIFVKDGPKRPGVKRNKKVKTQPHWLITKFDEMIELFGFYSYMAPGEAEGELARLSCEGTIDAVLTDDSDAAIFGARCIIRSLDKKNRDMVTVYTSKALQNTPTVGLTLGGMLLLAVLRGGDYDTVGLANCGITTAHALARCGFGDTLLAAVLNMADGELQHFLIGWREELRTELASNSRGFMKSKQSALSTKVPITFPSIKVLKLYAKPITSWSEGFHPPATEKWVAQVPNLPDLALYCQRKFGWSPLDLVGKFKKQLFAGAFKRRLTLVSLPFLVLNGYVLMSLFLASRRPATSPQSCYPWPHNRGTTTALSISGYH
ncbi:PIN domain-like protein, partial [Mycena metata]